MIIFHKIRWKNFLSTGNIFTEVQLDAHPNTLIVGENGAGKSTILDALTFVLFNKPYRNINKPQIVNSINTKECLVEVEFSLGNKDYLVRRGIKPNLFEIYLDDKLVNQDAKARDYQDMLERMILKMNYKSFTQIVILGSSSFTPFMQLTAADRRAVIEDLLDIQIFSNMNAVVKDKLGSIKTEYNELKIRLDAVKEKIDLHKRHIEDLKKNNTALIEVKRKEIEDAKHQMIELEQQGRKHQEQVDALLMQIGDETVTNSKHGKLNTFETKIETNKRKVEKEVEFYKDNDSCPTCKQSIGPDYKHQRIQECANKIVELDAGLEKLKEEKNAVITRLRQIAEVNSRITALGRDIANTTTSISHTRRYIDLLEREVDKLTNNSAVNADTKEQSKELFEELSGYIERRKKITEEKQYLDVAAMLLKDSGIKTRIIRQYLPVINKFVNKYLSAMEFFVNFQIDEEFKETIKSRHRDDFSYQNFSEGEKQRIDLALLLTWRAVARIKNSVNTNLLILDETFDSSLDSKGTDTLLEILHQVPDNTNIFVISHKDQLHDKFQNSIRFEKKHNFSRIAA